jgi:hypothetical protein
VNFDLQGVISIPKVRALINLGQALAAKVKPVGYSSIEILE